MIKRDDIERILDMIGLTEDVEKYIDSIETVFNLFNKIDEYEDNIKDLDPLYHPLEILLEPEEDNPVESYGYEHLDKDEDGYVRGPPLRRR